MNSSNYLINFSNVFNHQTVTRNSSGKFNNVSDHKILDGIFSLTLNQHY